MLNLTQRLAESFLSPSIRVNQFLNLLDIVVKIFTKYPKKVKIDETEEGEETPENSKIEHIEELLGFAVVSIADFMETEGLKNISKKYQIFEYSDPTIFRNHELHWPLSQELQIISQNADKIQQEKAEKYEPKEVKIQKK